MTLPHLRAVMNRIAAALGESHLSVTQVGRNTRDPFLVLMSCLLSLRTRDETTAEASKRLFALGRSPGELAAVPTRILEQAIFPVGFYRTKAKRIREICALLLRRHGGCVPEEMEALLQLPGVGRKTANIVLVYGFGKPGIPVDTHCHRIPNRIGWVHTRTPEETEQVLRRALPRRYWLAFNDLLVRFGKQTCRPVSPRCGDCPVLPFCDRKGLPPLGAKPRRKGKRRPPE